MFLSNQGSGFGLEEANVLQGVKSRNDEDKTCMCPFLSLIPFLMLDKHDQFSKSREKKVVGGFEGV